MTQSRMWLISLISLANKPYKAQQIKCHMTKCFETYVALAIYEMW